MNLINTKFMFLAMGLIFLLSFVQSYETNFNEFTNINIETDYNNLSNLIQFELEKLDEGKPPNKILYDLWQQIVSIWRRAQNMKLEPGEFCNRGCRHGQQRLCYFKFNLEYYHAMGSACGKCADGIQADCFHPQCIIAEGVQKGVMSINRKIPGPAIHVCKNDYVVVDVENNAHGSAASIHWHGIHMRDSPFMDGVPFATQCPIMFANTFRYAFRATEPGTQFYHSHSGHHKVNGQYGAFIIREPTGVDSNSKLYDYDLPEHYILISDWMHSYGEMMFPGLPRSIGILPNSVLINGRGRFINPRTFKRSQVPMTIYFVKPGKNYRFRIINSISHACPFQLQIENHTMNIIASDSYNVKAEILNTIVSNSGERYDFVLNANQKYGDYLIRVRGLGICGFRPTESFAILRYKRNDDNKERMEPNLPSYNEQYPLGTHLNSPNANCFGGENDHCVTELSAHTEDKSLRFSDPDYKMFLAFTNHKVDNSDIFSTGEYHHFANLNGNETIIGTINNISLIFPSYPPLTQPDNIKENHFCDENNLPNSCENKKICFCSHRIKIPLNKNVELIIVDETPSVGPMHHPFHIHGYRFMVVGLGKHPLGVPMTVPIARKMDNHSKLPRFNNNRNPPWKDTVSIPSRGYAIVRFRSDNPGFWLMHCHYEWHLSIGMGLIVQVGELTDMVSPPKNFPKCGNYLPEIKRSEFFKQNL